MRPQDRKQHLIIDSAIGIGLPVLEMIFSYIAQGHRYNIFEDIGCFPALYYSPVAFALVMIWPLAINLVSAVYGALAIRALMTRRNAINKFLAESNSSLSMGVYYRSMALASTEVVFAIPFNIYLIYNNTRRGILPWKGWEDAHSNFSRVLQIPSVEWTLDYEFFVAMEATRWSIPICAFLFFFFFGFSGEARRIYRQVYEFCLRRVPFIPKEDNNKTTMSTLIFTLPTTSYPPNPGADTFILDITKENTPALPEADLP